MGGADHFDTEPLTAGDFAIAAVFTGGTDPTGSSEKIGIRANCAVDANPLAAASAEYLYDYIRPWYESLHAHPDLRGIILYDRLPPHFVERWTSRQVTFLSYEIAEKYREKTSAILQRIPMLVECLVQRQDISRMWFTDINDVGFTRNPFRLLDQIPQTEEYFVVGEEWTTFRKSQWWSGQADFFGGELREMFAGHFADMYLVTVGVWGGCRGVVEFMLREFMRELDRLLELGKDLVNRPGGCADMAIMNLVVFKHLFSRVATFKMESKVEGLIFEPGVFLRGISNPIIHHRPAAIKVAEELARQPRR